jgi:hypothetical protein
MIDNIYRVGRILAAILSCVVIVAIVVANLGTKTPSASPDATSPAAAVAANLTELVIKNKGVERWRYVQVTVDREYAYTLLDVDPGRAERIPLILFVKNSGERFQPMQRAPRTVEIAVSGYAASAAFSF